MRKSTASVFILTIGVLSLGGCPAREEVPDRPNVLIIVLDTTRADVLGCYGHAGALTPRLDRLAEAGTVFTRAYATDFWTLPSHASLLTGFYPTQCRATSETNHLPAEVTTLAERLSRAGYATGGFVANAWISAERGFDQGFDDYVEFWREKATSPIASEMRGALRAAAWIEERADDEAPFFAFVNLNVAHMPYQPSPGMWRSVRSREWPPDLEERLRRLTGMWGHLAGRNPLGPPEFRLLRELYEAEIAHADALVTRILAALDRAGIADETLVIVTSDHGENLGDHGMIDHLLSMYETTIHVPLLVRHPAHFPAGRRIEDLTSLVDVVPTVLFVCGLPRPEDEQILLPGRDLASPAPSPPPHVVAENDRPVNAVKLLREKFPRFDASSIDHPIRTLITDRHKLIWHLPDRTELYDLAADPGETRDLSATEPGRRREMLEILEQWTKATKRSPIRAEEFEGRDPEARERLRGLTYVR